MIEVLQALTKAIENRQPVALATVIEVRGASPGREGFKLLVRPDGRCGCPRRPSDSAGIEI
jgi:xanthine/CO dehydrogenase XdhC/CoxF family maturation factor